MAITAQSTAPLNPPSTVPKELAAAIDLSTTATPAAVSPLPCGGMSSDPLGTPRSVYGGEAGPGMCGMSSLATAPYSTAPSITALGREAE